ncbi:MAG TPA: hypothetical protein ENH26_02505 [Candidatus Wolfebacteria bacterium]|nr:hypothetical protein [Candidatus Wolfebacteria bacterium]
MQNVVDANLQACENGMAEFSGEVFNIAFGKRITLNELVRNLNKILKKDIKSNYADPRPGDVKHSLANIGKARQFLEYELRIDFEEGLKKQ